ncbi:uncharacterized protein BCR38DRAFT_420833 [Pseudomassariella vexata]|uniref:Uncharacterized protein n=1 Tax=Pseudomassariella vexata TaxID=1141098 RepID=A0A1Y2EEP2_9PEZI|nr:uncharacterized protein BCR38DRAFT_420833 [Pseudomassariella vexata]ORY70041.1 hypothetical protein BCR38DRAFT_420833 [Pseudomassariella vexata]
MPAWGSFLPISLPRPTNRRTILCRIPSIEGVAGRLHSSAISGNRKTYYKIPKDAQGADLWSQNDLRLPTNIRNNYTLLGLAVANYGGIYQLYGYSDSVGRSVWDGCI